MITYRIQAAVGLFAEQRHQCARRPLALPQGGLVAAHIGMMSIRAWGARLSLACPRIRVENRRKRWRRRGMTEGSVAVALLAHETVLER